MARRQESKRLEKVRDLRRKHSKHLSSDYGLKALTRRLVSEDSKSSRRTVLSQHQASKRLKKVQELRCRNIQEDVHVDFDFVDDTDPEAQPVQGGEPEIPMEELGRISRRDEKGRLVWYSRRVWRKKEGKC